MNKKILLSLGVIGVVAAVAISSTGAFFSDSETSTGNTFTAGAIDLKVDSQQHYAGLICTLLTPTASTTLATEGYYWQIESQTTTRPELVGAPCSGTWTMKDLVPGVDKFFNFTDVKPGDMGENTISLHIDNNAAYACADLSNILNNENTHLQPEINAGDATASDPNAGELGQNLDFLVWNDNGAAEGHAGNNIWDADEVGTNTTGGAPLAPATYTLADSTGTPIPPTGTSYLGLAWCAGTFTAGGPGVAPVCDGSTMGNQAQTDSYSADIGIRVVQSRNNGSFICTPPVAGPIVVGANDLDAGPRATAATNGSGKWFMYDDFNDVINNSLGSFVAGPLTPPAGTGSVQFALGTTSDTQREDIATYAYQGTLLSNISALNFSAYSHSGVAGPTESPYLVFDVDFATSTTALYSGRLVYVPSANGAVPQDTWNTYNTINGGAGLWTWSGLAKGPDKIASTADDNTWPDGNTNQYRTWASIVAAFPNAKIASVAGLLGVRVGEPGPANYIGNIDKFEINIGSGLVTYDFGN